MAGGEKGNIDQWESGDLSRESGGNNNKAGPAGFSWKEANRNLPLYMSCDQNSLVQMAKYHGPQRSGDIVMIQSEHTGAVDILSADLESADLLGDHRRGETFGAWNVFLFCSYRYLKKGRQIDGRKEKA